MSKKACALPRKDKSSSRKFFSRATMLIVLVMLWPGADVLAAGGIGFAQAEEGTWYCWGDNPVATLNWARRKCRTGAEGQKCFRTKWCYGPGWSGLMTVFLSEFHSTEIICGAPSETALRSGLKAFCAGNEIAQSCSIFLLIRARTSQSSLNSGARLHSAGMVA